jgi:hypothetical protein
MKSVQIYKQQELLDFIGSLWVTDEFKNANKDSNSEVYKVIQQVVKSPVYFYEMSDPIERTQFSTWWRAVQIRKYDIPAVTDLYYFHEFCHMATLDRNPNLNDAEWIESVFKNELYASMWSEVYIYFDYPTLREKTFKFPIWADRFISLNIPLEEKKKLSVEERLRIFKKPIVGDGVEMGIHKYNTQNLVWCNYWIDVRKSINLAINSFETACGLGYYDYAASVLDCFYKENLKDGVLFKQYTELFHEYTKDSIITIFKG